MPFEAGNSGGIKGRSGRKKALTTIMKEAMDFHREKLPGYFAQLAKMADDGDREALIYLINQLIGKPKIAVDISGGQKLGEGMVLGIIRAVRENRELEQGIKLLD